DSRGRFAAAQPSARRLGRSRAGTLLPRSNLYVYGQFCAVAIAFGKGTDALRSDLPPLACPSDRIGPPKHLTGRSGVGAVLSWLSGPGIGAEQRSHRRESEAAPSAILGSGLGKRLSAAFACWRERSPGGAGEPAGCGDDRAGFHPVPRNGDDLMRVGQGQEWRYDGGNGSPAQRFGRLSRYRGG